MDKLHKTALHALQLELGARMVPFAGYEMPVQYTHGIKHEHQHCRTQAGLFDISHMGQIKIYGEDAANQLEKAVTGNIEGLKPYHQRYTVMTNDEGGIIDDIMITRAADHLFLIVNAACKEKDMAHLQNMLTSGCRLEVLNDRSLLALQGPMAEQVLRQFIYDIDQISFMQAGNFEIDNIYCFINRCGYTGEDGFEISVHSKDVEKLTRLLLADEAVEMVGLGARDTLRMEAGLCLYGHDIDEQTTPVEASIAWVIAKKYRVKDASKDASAALFPGAERILSQYREGSEIVRTGFRPEGRVLVREGTKIENDNGVQVGTITSGCYGQSVGGPIAMGYVQKKYAAPDTKLTVVIRGRSHTICVAAIPFIEHHYCKR